MFEHLCATLLQQSHLCPVPLEAQPVFWNFDHALHLYPIPDVLVLADRAPCASFAFPPMPADQLDQSCICLNPVSTPPVSSNTGMTSTTDARSQAAWIVAANTHLAPALAPLQCWPPLDQGR